MEGTELFKNQIQAYLNNEAEKDANFKRLMEERNDITIDHVCNHIFNTVQKAGKCGWSDEEIFEMARDCYNDGIKEESGTTPNQIVSNCHIELTQEEKDKAKADALEEIKNQEIARVIEEKRKENERLQKLAELEAKKKQKALEKAQEQERKAKGDQLSLDDIFGDL